MSAAQELGTWFFNYFDHLPFSLIFEEDESSIGPVRRLQDGASLKGRAVDDCEESRLSLNILAAGEQLAASC